jgi:propionyl-CoA carboxylase alpha chain
LSTIFNSRAKSLPKQAIYAIDTSDCSLLKAWNLHNYRLKIVMFSPSAMFRLQLLGHHWRVGARNLVAGYSSKAFPKEKWEEMYTAHTIDPNEKTFDKILIANRGEIACRVIRTARRMGIKTVAVHSVADAGSLFVKMADEAVNIGPAPARESYLVMDKIMNAVRETGAQAVHPGYGFLSENTAFVAELEKAGVAFIGPNSKAIEGMGDKLASKRLAAKAKVNLIPGFDGVVENADHCVKLSNDITYPVMIKASAGGGGKGMRIAWNDAEAREAFKLCSEEGAASFGDDRMLVEKFVDSPRHVEIQVLGDKHGNVIHLNERECSIQRRNQKVIEEAPSPFLDPETRAAMGAQAISLSKAIGYDSAGTVEFLVDSKKKFFFLEMNTRLQVEHPITECITGVDLVHQMIRSAAGLPLKLAQSDIGIRGWAVENRVYAEDPFKNFGMPSIGRLHKYEEPKGIPGVRCDSGIEEGSEISMYYDPMICKLTTYGDTRADAISTAVEALDSYVIRGVTHNIPMLRDILEESKFNAGNFTTNYLPETYPDGFIGSALTDSEQQNLAVIAASMYCKEQERAFAPNMNGNVVTVPKESSLIVSVGGKDIFIQLKKSNEKYVAVFESGTTLRLKDNFRLADSVVHAETDCMTSVVQLISRQADGTLRIRYKGTAMNVPVQPALAADLKHHMKEKPKLDLSRVVLSPMPGVVKSVSIEVGQMVGEGQGESGAKHDVCCDRCIIEMFPFFLECCVVEAMKMQNSMKASVTGKVKAVNVKAGDTVEEEDVLVELE